MPKKSSLFPAAFTPEKLSLIHIYIPETADLPAPRYVKGASNEEALVTQNSSEKKQQSKVQRLSILALACSFIFLVAGVSVFLTANQSDNTIQSLSVLNPDVTLYPGGYERLQIATVPDDTDRGVIECHSDSNPWITATKTADWEDANPWTEAWSVAAERDWKETLPFSGKVSVMGGEAIPVYIDVTVEEPAYKSAGSAEGQLPRQATPASPSPLSQFARRVGLCPVKTSSTL